MAKSPARWSGQAEPESVYSAPSWLRRLAVRQVVAALAIAALAWVTSPRWLGYLPDSLVYFRDLREARGMIDRIEQVHRVEGRFPTDLCALNLPCDESADFHYDRNDGGYVLWFSAPTHGFFATLTYEPSTKSWHVGH
jgi:hypothetical protein